MDGKYKFLAGNEESTSRYDDYHHAMPDPLAMLGLRCCLSLAVLEKLNLPITFGRKWCRRLIPAPASGSKLESPYSDAPK